MSSPIIRLWQLNPRRVAWIVLLANFTACCALAVAVPLVARGYILHSTQRRDAVVTALEGTVQLWAPSATEPTAVTDPRKIVEGSRVVTDNTARSLVTVFADAAGEQVLTNVQLFQATSMQITLIRTPRFASSADPDRIELSLEQGRILVATQETEQRPAHVLLKTPQAVIFFTDGAFDISIQDGETQVRVRSGSAAVLALGTEVTAHAGERVSVPTDEIPGLPVPGAQNLVKNGDFTKPFDETWKIVQDVPEGLVAGQVTQEADGQRQVVRFARKTEDGAPNSVGVIQELDRDVQGYDSLVLRFDLRILYQSVPGGGYLASEYPVMVDISYTDIYGKDLHWYQGFYYRDLTAGLAWLQPEGEKIPLGIWYTYESPNLFESLTDTPPSRINSITIYASGHDYDSMVTDVALSTR